MKLKKPPRRHMPSQRRGKKTGLAPGTPVFVGEQKLESVRIHIMRYSSGHFDETKNGSLSDCVRPGGDSGVTWINIDGVHDVHLVQQIGERFGLHLLTVEDIVNTTQRPKAEEFSNYLFLVLKMMSYNAEKHDIDIEHVSLIVGEGYVISFLEDEGDVFDTVRDRLRSDKGKIRTLHADYLAYSLMDAVVDNYFLALEFIGDLLEEMDDLIIENPTPAHMHELHRLKQCVLALRKSVWPLREEINVIERSESTLLHSGTRVFLRDLYDHTIQVIDIVENYRELLSGMHDTYLSSVSIRLNDIMKVLTIIATIFIPLTFIAGVYGMNFDHMPELHWRYGYYLIWGIMISIAAGMLVFFRKRKWL